LEFFVRKPFVAGNWKMNLNKANSVALASQLSDIDVGETVDVAICPPSVYLDCVSTALGDGQVRLGAQDVYYQEKGAFTGEISPAMLADVGCRYAILGHSERRHVIGETDELINKKVHAALAGGLIPIVCVGELLEQREAGQTMDVIRAQFTGSLANLDAAKMENVVIAYEPVWAIGTGQVASPEQAEEVHSDLRKLLENSYNQEVAQSVRIQYGGSVKPDNALDLLAQPNIDGALVGGASLKADDFAAIIKAAKV
jgi:triosephosphate isomerase